MVLFPRVGLFGWRVKYNPCWSAHCRSGSAPGEEVVALVCQKGWWKLKSPATMQGPEGRKWLSQDSQTQEIIFSDVNR